MLSRLEVLGASSVQLGPSYASSWPGRGVQSPWSEALHAGWTASRRADVGETQHGACGACPQTRLNTEAQQVHPMMMSLIDGTWGWYFFQSRDGNQTGEATLEGRTRVSTHVLG